jgi:ketosteroid isomerase-like protein
MAAFTVVLLTRGSNAKAQQHMTGQQQQVVDTMNTLFAALHQQDSAKLNTVVTPDYYIFDNGARYNSSSVLAFLKSLHASGKQIDWNITNSDVHIFGDHAWIAYVNQGSITANGTKSSQQWLESAFLDKRADTWKIEFMHSTRVPSPASTSK